MKRLRHPLIAATLVAASTTVVLLALSPSWAARSVAADLRRRIDAADEPTAASFIETLAALDIAGSPHLIELLDDSRPAIRQAARRAMSERLQVWCDERSTSNPQKTEQLASLLAEHKPPSEMHSRVFVKLMALKLLRCSDDITQARRVRFLTSCSTILERATGAGQAELAAAPQPKAAREPFAFELDLPSHEAIPYEPYSLPAEEGAEKSPEPAASDREPETQAPTRIEAHQPRRINLAGDATAQIDDTALRALSTRSLMRRLHDAPEAAASVENELRQRGFNEQTLEVARQLDDADPKIRQQLAEALPSMAGIDPAPWLWALSDDEDENVRRAARNILATSSNPQTRARVGRLR